MTNIKTLDKVKMIMEIKSHLKSPEDYEMIKSLGYMKKNFKIQNSKFAGKVEFALSKESQEISKKSDCLISNVYV